MEKTSVLIFRKLEEASEKVRSINPLSRLHILEKSLALLEEENRLIERYLASPGDFFRKNRCSFFRRLCDRLCGRPILFVSSPKHLFEKTLSDYALITAILNRDELELCSNEERLLSIVYKNLLNFPLA